MATRTKGNTCGSKRPHPDRAAAQAHVQRLVRQGAAPGLMTTYRCRLCGAWHVGHRERRK
jgi:hypothetical protein